MSGRKTGSGSGKTIKERLAKGIGLGFAGVVPVAVLSAVTAVSSGFQEVHEVSPDQQIRCMTYNVVSGKGSVGAPNSPMFGVVSVTVSP